MICHPTLMHHVYVRILSRVRNGINGTPTFYMNGIRIRNNGSWDLRTLQKTLRSKSTKDNLGSRFVTVRGREYCFMPGMQALKWLASLDD
jgi:hypothetical protein